MFYYTKYSIGGTKDGWNRVHDVMANQETMGPGFGNYAVFTFCMLLAFYMLFAKQLVAKFSLISEKTTKN